MPGLDPDAEKQRLAGLYVRLSDAELQKLADDAPSLSESAQQALREEIARRGSQVNLREGPLGFFVAEQQHWTMVHRFRDLPEAVLAKGQLDASGIENFLADDNLVRLDWFWSNAIGGIKLFVKPEDADIANEILTQPIPDAFDIEGVGEYEQPKCPKCGSADIAFEELDKGVAFGSAWLLSLPIPLHNRGWKCQACGHRWEDPEPPDESSVDAANPAD